MFETRAAVHTAAFFLGCVALPAAAQIIPAPEHVTPLKGCFAVTSHTALLSPPNDAAAVFAAEYLKTQWQRSNQIHFAAPAHAAGGSIRFVRDPAFKPEAYRLHVGAEGATITAADDAGLFYGAVSLWQLLPAGRPGRCVPAQDIDDAPRFGWRGLMLDSARHFQSVDFVKRMIDWMAWQKLNVLHWHLTDDQGWRIEIKKYPKLTSIGAWRGPDHYGGFYSQAEVADIVRFAAARGVRIVPEIDMPGHVMAALAAYPELGPGGKPIEVSSAWGVHTHLLNLRPQTLSFLEEVLSELLVLFPSRDIHVGGDEVVKTEWLESPDMQGLAKSLGLPDAAALQPYLTQHMAAFLSARGRRLVGWDEVLTPELPKDAVVMSWRGLSGAETAVRAGNDTVLSPDPALYLDHRQSSLPNEPPGRLAPITSKDIYQFKAMDDGFSAAERSHVLGVQANLWSEHIRTEERMAWMAFPRGAALSEVAWSQQRDWPGFVTRLPDLFVRYQQSRMHYADSIFGITTDFKRESPHKVAVTLANGPELEGIHVSIHYTLDGKAPSAASPVYSRALKVAEGTPLRAATFMGGRQVSRVMRADIDRSTGVRRDSHALTLCSNGVGLLLEPPGAEADRYMPMAVDIMNPCWIAPQVELSQGAEFTAAVAPLPFNFEIGKALDSIRVGDARTRRGEMEIHADSCDTPAIATLPLEPAKQAGISVLPAVKLPVRPGRHDLCLRFARPGVDPIWGIDWIEVK
jgi:hexosaminidase